jgi:hypothetical protein
MYDENGVSDYVQAVQEAVADYHPRWLIAGNETNLHSETDDEEMQAWWVARVVFGHGTDPNDTGNVFQFARTADPDVMVLAPAVGPYSPDTAGDTNGCEIPDGRGILAPWESYMYDLARSSYNNEWHVPEIGDVKFAIHTYGRTGGDGRANGGPEEPWNDVREGTYGAQFGSRWLQDALFYCRQGLLNSAYGVDYYPGGILISEANTLTDAMPCDSYPNGWWQNLIRYVNQFPNVMGLAAFVDQDLGGMWSDTAMSIPKEQLRVWNQDHDYALQQGWRIGEHRRRGRNNTIEAGE